MYLEFDETDALKQGVLTPCGIKKLRLSSLINKILSLVLSISQSVRTIVDALCKK